MAENLTFKELKARVSVIDVATFLGYQLDKSKGLSQPSYVLTSNGQEVDRIYIKNPRDTSIQGYWRRGTTKGGDVINFVKENLSSFNVQGRNDIDNTNIVLHNFANAVYTPPETSKYFSKYFQPKSFDINRFLRVENTYFRDRIFESRGIDRDSSRTFGDHIHLIQDKEASAAYTNIAFPYTIPGQKECVGYEIRGVGGFKSKAPGTNSTDGMWIADFTHAPQEVRNIYIAESAFDAISYYQINRSKIDLSSSVFVSFGGSFSDKQFKGLTDYYSTAKPTLLFDNDLYGKMYDIRAFMLLQNKSLETRINKEDETVHFKIEDKSFSIPIEEVSIRSFLHSSGMRTNNDELSINKAKGAAKDWNDVLQLEADTESKYSVRR